MLKEYHQSDDQDDMCKDGEESDQAPELLTSRNDFDFMVNDFLNNYEILGRQMKLKIGGETGPEKLDTLRRAMGQDEQLRIADPAIEDDEENFVLSDQEDEKEKWDCETVLSMFVLLSSVIHLTVIQPLTRLLEITHVLSVLETRSQFQSFNSITKRGFP